MGNTGNRSLVVSPASSPHPHPRPRRLTLVIHTALFSLKSGCESGPMPGGGSSLCWPGVVVGTWALHKSQLPATHSLTHTPTRQTKTSGNRESNSHWPERGGNVAAVFLKVYNDLLLTDTHTHTHGWRHFFPTCKYQICNQKNFKGFQI